jgi:hypothetical protein
VSGLPVLVACRDEASVVPTVDAVVVLVVASDPAGEVVGLDGDGVVEALLGVEDGESSAHGLAVGLGFGAGHRGGNVAEAVVRRVGWRGRGR